MLPPKLEPMRLARRSQPFDHPDWLYEIKFDGFRALAYVEAVKCRLVSRRRHVHKSFHELCASIANRLGGNEAILDGLPRSVRPLTIQRVNVPTRSAILLRVRSALA